jgi:hypothetical protein
MNPLKGLFFLSAMALAVAVALPAEAQTQKPYKMSAKREAAVKKCFEEAASAMPAGTSSGFRADSYRTCMAKQGERP